MASNVCIVPFLTILCIILHVSACQWQVCDAASLPPGRSHQYRRYKGTQDRRAVDSYLSSSVQLFLCFNVTRYVPHKTGRSHQIPN